MRDPLRTIVRRATNTPQILRQYEADQQNQNKRERTGALSSLKVRTTLCKSSIYGFDERNITLYKQTTENAAFTVMQMIKSMSLSLTD